MHKQYNFKGDTGPASSRNSKVMAEFNVQLQKLLSSQVLDMKWSQKMDMLVLVLGGYVLELLRVSYCLQKVFRIQEDQPVLALDFSPDSFLLVYGCLDGSIRVVRVQNAETVFQVSRLHSCPISTISFEEFFSFPEPLSLVKPASQSISSKLLTTVSMHSLSDKATLLRLKQAAEPRKSHSLLCSTSNEGQLVLSLNGLTPMVRLQLWQQGNCHAISCSLGQRTLDVVVQQQHQSFNILALLKYDLSKIIVKKDQIIRTLTLQLYINQLTAFFQNSITALDKGTAQLRKKYFMKVSLLDDLIQASEPRGKAANLQLLDLLELGVSSPEVAKCFNTQLSDVKVLSKLDQSLTVIFGNLFDILLESGTNVVQRIFLNLECLASYAVDPRYQTIGLRREVLSGLVRKTKQLYARCEQFMFVLIQAKTDVHNLLAWFARCICKVHPEQEAEGDSSRASLSRQPLDLKRLRAFLMDQRRYCLQHLRDFFDSDLHLTGQALDIPLQEQTPDKEGLDLLKEIYKLADCEFPNISVSNRQMQEQQVVPGVSAILRQFRREWSLFYEQPQKGLSSQVPLLSKTAIGRFPTDCLLIKPRIQAHEVVISSKGDVVVCALEDGACRQYKLPRGLRALDFEALDTLFVLARGDGQSADSTVLELQEEQNQLSIVREIQVKKGLRISSTKRGLTSLIADPNKLMILQ